MKEVDDNLGLVNMVHYKPTEYNEIKEESKEFCHPPIKVQISSSNNLDPKVENKAQEITSTNLNEIEQVIMQDTSSEIFTITDEDDPQTLNNKLPIIGKRDNFPE